MAPALSTGHFKQVLEDFDGYPFLSEPVLAYKEGTNAAAELYEDPELVTPLTSPATDDTGNFAFFARAGRVDLVVRGDRQTVPVPPIQAVVVLTALPTAAAKYQGDLVTITADGQADKTYLCLRASNGTYSWKQVATL